MDYYYLFWLLSLKFKLPSEFSTAVQFAFVGFMAEANKKIGSSLENQRKVTGSKFQEQLANY